ncbi:MAG: HAD-IIB family hydrolase, partial [Intestinibaculum porci]
MKLVFFDIDGTLAHGLEVPASTQSAIKQLRKNGHKVLICTGRAISYVKKYFAQYADGYIAFNGRYG